MKRITKYLLSLFPYFFRKSNVFVSLNKEIAGDVATTFFKSIKGVPQESIIAELDSIMDWDGKTSMYVFNFKPAGYVLTSADVRNEPIVAYSQDNNFTLYAEDGLPDGLANRLAETIIGNRWIQEGAKGWEKNQEVLQEMLQNNIDSWFALQRQEASQSESVFQLNPETIAKLFPWWASPCGIYLVESSMATYGYYCQTTWGQFEPYNYYTPNQYPAGCVAVALGQIMRFHQYPADWYNWSIMPNNCTSTYNSMSAGELAVANLLSDIGFYVGMNYTANLSTAFGSNARNALVNVYGYSGTANINNYDYDKIVNEIKTQKHPIYVEGDGTKYMVWLFFYKYKDGHAFVIDGYREVTKKYYNVCLGTYHNVTTKFLHYNFSVIKDKDNGSRYDGWFSTNIRDDAGYIDWDNIAQQEFPNFKYNKRCIYNIKP